MSEIIKKEPVARQAQIQATNSANVKHHTQKVNRYNGFESNILHHMQSNGIECQGPVVLDTKIHRFSSDSNKSKKDEWYVGPFQH